MIAGGNGYVNRKADGQTHVTVVREKRFSFSDACSTKPHKTHTINLNEEEDNAKKRGKSYREMIRLTILIKVKVK